MDRMLAEYGSLGTPPPDAPQPRASRDPEAKLVLLVRKILNVDDLRVLPSKTDARLDLRHDNLVRKIHQRVIFHRIGLPAAIEDVDAVSTAGRVEWRPPDRSSQ